MQAECNRELQQLDREVHDHEQRLAQVQEELQAARAQEADLGQRASAAERRLQVGRAQSWEDTCVKSCTGWHKFVVLPSTFAP